MTDVREDAGRVEVRTWAAGRLGVDVSEVAEVQDTPDGPVATDGTGHRILITDEQLYWYGDKAPNPGLPLFVPTEPPPPADGEVLDDDPDGGPVVVEDLVVEEPYPEGGTRDAVLRWVADDPQRAAYALEREKATAKPRPTVVAELERLSRVGG